MLNKFIRSCSLFFFSAGMLFGQSQIVLLKNGLEYAYNLNFQKSDSVFNDVISKYPESPSGYYYLSQNHFWKYLGCRDEAELIIFNKFSELALRKAEEKLDVENDALTKFILGSTYLLKAAANTSKGNSWSAFLDSKHAIGDFEDIIKANPAYNDAYFGLGVFNYALSFVPGLFKVALDITGLDYDREKALQYLTIAFNDGILTKDEAAFHLSKINFEFTGNYSEAEKYIDLLLSKYPDNVLFYYQKSLIEIEKKDLPAAEALLNVVIELHPEKFAQTTSFANMLLGDIYFKRNQFGTAIKYFNKYFETTATLDYVGYANLRCALAYKFIGEDENYRRHLLLAGNGNNEIDEDSYAAELSGELLEGKFDSEFKDYILAFNLYSAGNNAETVTFIDSVFEKNGVSNSLLIIKAAALNENELFEESLSTLDKIDYDSIIDDWLRPLAELTKAEDFAEMEKLKIAEEHLSNAEDELDGYRSNYIRSQINFWRNKITATSLREKTDK